MNFIKVQTKNLVFKLNLLTQRCESSMVDLLICRTYAPYFVKYTYAWL